MHDDGQSGAVLAFRQYAQAFQTLDPRAVAPYFHQPALMISPRGVQVLASAAEVEAAYGRLMSDLRSKGFTRTELSTLVERRLGDDLAVVSGTATWKTSQGPDLASFGMTYTLRRVGDAWRLVVLAIHPPDPHAPDAEG